eukprot:6769767-Pyramimonas_sp.AAC.1
MQYDAYGQERDGLEAETSRAGGAPHQLQQAAEAAGRQQQDEHEDEEGERGRHGARDNWMVERVKRQAKRGRPSGRLGAPYEGSLE